MSPIPFVLLLAIAAEVEVARLQLLSPAFESKQPLPARYTCEEGELSPPLAWRGVPEATRSLALVVEDPEGTDNARAHWVLYDLPPTLDGLREGVRLADLPAGTREGENDWGQVGWRAPCPPTGRRRYEFRLYALDVALGDQGALSASQLESALAGHILAEAELIGTYQKKGEL